MRELPEVTDALWQVLMRFWRVLSVSLIVNMIQLPALIMIIRIGDHY